MGARVQELAMAFRLELARWLSVIFALVTARKLAQVLW